MIYDSSITVQRRGSILTRLFFKPRISLGTSFSWKPKERCRRELDGLWQCIGSLGPKRLIWG